MQDALSRSRSLASQPCENMEALFRHPSTPRLIRLHAIKKLGWHNTSDSFNCLSCVLSGTSSLFQSDTQQLDNKAGAYFFLPYFS